jgi:hypothetical protein
MGGRTNLGKNAASVTEYQEWLELVRADQPRL